MTGPTDPRPGAAGVRRGDHVGVAVAPHGGLVVALPGRTRRSTTSTPRRCRGSTRISGRAGCGGRRPRPPRSSGRASVSPRAGMSRRSTGCCSAGGAPTRPRRGPRRTASTPTPSRSPASPTCSRRPRTPRSSRIPSMPVGTCGRSGLTAGGRRRPAASGDGRSWRSSSPPASSPWPTPCPGGWPRLPARSRRPSCSAWSCPPTACPSTASRPSASSPLWSGPGRARRPTPTSSGPPATPPCCATPRRAGASTCGGPTTSGRCCDASGSTCLTPVPGGWRPTATTIRSSPPCCHGARPSGWPRRTATTGSTRTSGSTGGCAGSGRDRTARPGG